MDQALPLLENMPPIANKLRTLQERRDLYTFIYK